VNTKDFFANVRAYCNGRKCAGCGIEIICGMNLPDISDRDIDAVESATTKEAAANE